MPKPRVSPRTSRRRSKAPVPLDARLGSWLVRLSGLRGELRAAAAEGEGGELADWLRADLRARRSQLTLFRRGFVGRDEVLRPPADPPAGPHAHPGASAWLAEHAALLVDLESLLPPGAEPRRDCYVYVHRAPAGAVFYVGKGTGRRAWSRERSTVWRRYVDERLGGTYAVEVVREGLTHAEALAAEAELIAALGTQLVNLENPGRSFDAETVERARLLRAETLGLVGTTQFIEAARPAEAVARYRRALDDVRRWCRLPVERGLLGELAGADRHGEPIVLDRLTRCLERLGQHAELVAEAERYFAEFPDAAGVPAGERVRRRVARANLALGRA